MKKLGMGEVTFMGLLVRLMGAVQIGVGLIAALYGPLEWHVFSLFSRNGRFHYEGFGFGSLWFGLLVIQNIAYYIIAALLLPTGYGTVRHRRWALPLTRLILWLWLGGGIILLLNLAVLTPALQQLELPRNVLLLRLGLVAGFISGGLILLPLLLLRFYRSATITQIFAADPLPPTWVDRRPLSLLILFVLLLGVILVLHLAQFFQAIFPFGSRLVMGTAGAYLITAAVFLLSGLIFGLAKQQIWAWWGTTGYFLLLTISTLLAFGPLTMANLVARMDLPPYELTFFAGVTVLQNYRPIWLMIVPLLSILGLLMYTKRYFATPK